MLDAVDFLRLDLKGALASVTASGAAGGWGIALHRLLGRHRVWQGRRRCWGSGGAARGNAEPDGKPGAGCQADADHERGHAAEQECTPCALRPCGMCGRGKRHQAARAGERRAQAHPDQALRATDETGGIAAQAGGFFPGAAALPADHDKGGARRAYGQGAVIRQGARGTRPAHPINDRTLEHPLVPPETGRSINQTRDEKQSFSLVFDRFSTFGIVG